MTQPKSPRQYTPEEEQRYAQRFLAKADQILAAVDEAYIISYRNHKPRLLPTFVSDEILIGKELGRGGFGIVHEIQKFIVQPETEQQQQQEGKTEGGLNCQQLQPDTNSTTGKNVSDNAANTGEDTSEINYNKNCSNDIKHNQQHRVAKVITEETDDNGTHYDHHDDHVHYDVEKAKHWMEERPDRNGSARYAVKRLRDGLNPLEKARGMVDMAVEAKFLSIVWHPNIIKIRGISKGNIVDENFFIILDRLHSTLNEAIKSWSNQERKFCGICPKLFVRNRQALKSLMVERMTVAYDLAAAFFYLHENRLVYRDIKPENIGFDFRGDVKVFDFGLCKSLSHKIRANNLEYGYKLTGRAGSLPYMAPEVAKMQTYDTKCDVFSFAILLWEMLALQHAFKEMSANSFLEKVVIQKQRLPVNKHWPPLTRLMIPEAWDDNPQKRPDMKRVAILIRADLNTMTTDEAVLHRTAHLRNRSEHSFRGELSLREVDDDLL